MRGDFNHIESGQEATQWRCASISDQSERPYFLEMVFWMKVQYLRKKQMILRKKGTNNVTPTNAWLHDIYLALMTSSSLANLSHSSSASDTIFATLIKAIPVKKLKILWNSFQESITFKTPEHRPFLPQASTGGVQQGNQADKVSHSLQQAEPWVLNVKYKMYCAKSY